MSDNASNERAMSYVFKEKGFDLKLPITVEGNDTYGKKFAEKTTLSYISHQGSSFWLNASVSLESELKLIIDLPPKLSDEKDLKLIIKGKVIFVESSKDNNTKQRISLKFGSKYIIKTDE